MAIDKIEEKKGRGRPRNTDPKIKLDSFRLKTSTLLDIEFIAEELGVSQNSLVQTILEAETQKYKKLLNLEEN